jgi:3-methyladenine DNA glycosylase AlkD
MTLMDEVRDAMEDAAGHPIPQIDQKSHKHEEYLSLGLKAADFHRLMKDFAPRFREITLSEALDQAEALLASPIIELGGAGITLLSLRVEELGPEYYARFERIAAGFRGWSYVDAFCFGILQPLLRSHRRETLELLERWSESPDRFKRRASVVAFTRKAAKSAAYTGEVLRLCEKLVWDRADTVRKGVGWALKDNLRSAPEQILPYIKDLRRRGVSSTITLYAIRDLKGGDRQDVLAVKAGSKPRD